MSLDNTIKKLNNSLWSLSDIQVLTLDVIFPILIIFLGFFSAILLPNLLIYLTMFLVIMALYLLFYAIVGSNMFKKDTEHSITVLHFLLGLIGILMTSYLLTSIGIDYNLITPTNELVHLIGLPKNYQHDIWFSLGGIEINYSIFSFSIEIIILAALVLGILRFIVQLFRKKKK